MHTSSVSTSTQWTQLCARSPACAHGGEEIEEIEKLQFCEVFKFHHRSVSIPSTVVCHTTSPTTYITINPSSPPPSCIIQLFHHDGTTNQHHHACSILFIWFGVFVCSTDLLNHQSICIQ